MLNLYEKNGLMFWSEEEISTRQLFQDRFLFVIKDTLKTINKAFDFFRIEAPLLTPIELINKQYLEENYTYKLDDLVLRPETTMGSYAYMQYLLNNHTKVKLPFVIWQHGKSFRREQDQSTKFMRLKEFYQLEFQILYSATTQNDYFPFIQEAIHKEMSRLLGLCSVVDSDRLPNYSEKTVDIILQSNNMELCSISLRKDVNTGSSGITARNLEIAIGTDRCMVNFLE